jgi:hypothetical protein
LADAEPQVFIYIEDFAKNLGDRVSPDLLKNLLADLDKKKEKEKISVVNMRNLAEKLKQVLSYEAAKELYDTFDKEDIKTRAHHIIAKSWLEEAKKHFASETRRLATKRDQEFSSQNVQERIAQIRHLLNLTDFIEDQVQDPERPRTFLTPEVIATEILQITQVQEPSLIAIGKKLGGNDLMQVEALMHEISKKLMDAVLKPLNRLFEKIVSKRGAIWESEWEQQKKELDALFARFNSYKDLMVGYNVTQRNYEEMSDRDYVNESLKQVRRRLVQAIQSEFEKTEDALRRGIQGIQNLSQNPNPNPNPWIFHR